ncbi:unnamed protein product, partial [Tilletia caries]
MNFGPPGFLHDDEKEALIKVTLHHEMAFSFDRSEKGLLKATYADPYQIRTVSHEPWIGKTIPFPKSRIKEIRDIYAEQIEAGDIEPADGPYVTPHFFVAKKNGAIRKVVDMSALNAVTIRDANVPPNLNDFCEALSGRVCYGSGDGHSFFDQIVLHPDSRPMTAIRTIHGMYQSTRLPQGATNSPAYAQRVSTHIYLDELSENVQVFVDDIVFKGPRSDQGNKTLEGTNLRLWFLEYLRTYSRCLRRYEHAGLTLSGEKFVAITPRVSITGVVIDRNGKHSDPEKVAKLENWPCPPPNISSLRGFLGLANYLRPFIRGFATIDAPLRKLLTGRFRWNDGASAAMENLKEAAKTQPILVAIDYTSSEPLVLAVDSSQLAAGWALFQGDTQEGQLRKLNQYGSVGFSDVESRYSQPQLELCGVFKAVKHLRHSLYGVFFILEVDAASLRQMINSPDIPNAAMTRWVQYLKLFDHEIRHVPAHRHTLPDGLSRTDFDTVSPAGEWPPDKIGLDVRPRNFDSSDDDKTMAGEKQIQHATPGGHASINSRSNVLIHSTPSTLGPSESDVADWHRRARGTGAQLAGVANPAGIDIEPSGTGNPSGTASEDTDDSSTYHGVTTTDSASSLSSDDPDDPIPLRTDLYTDKWLHLAEYLHSGLSHKILKPLPPSRRNWIKQMIGKFFVREGRLYRRGKKNDAPQLVIDSQSLKDRLMHEAHELHGHRGRDAMIALLSKRVWWERLAVDCIRHVSS